MLVLDSGKRRLIRELKSMNAYIGNSNELAVFIDMSIELVKFSKSNIVRSRITNEKAELVALDILKMVIEDSLTSGDLHLHKGILSQSGKEALKLWTQIAVHIAFLTRTSKRLYECEKRKLYEKIATTG